MNRLGVATFQVDRALRAQLEAFRRSMEAELGRHVPDAELLRVLLRQALAGPGFIRKSGYVEGFRAGMADGKRALATGIANVKAAPSAQ